MESKLHRATLLSVALAGALITTSSAAAAEATAGDPAAGRVAFNRTCRVCHQVEAGAGNALGPNLAGIAGAKAPVDATFAYSDAFKAAAAKGLVWDDASLDRFLAGPAKMIPGSKMPLSVADAAQRRNLVAYLATLKK